VQNISASARQQSESAQNIARNMHVLREISAQTADNSAATSTSIGKLAQLSGLMRKSVAGFRLPEIAKQPGSSSAAAGENGGKTRATPSSAAVEKKVSGLSA
jgi:twitching motility protein PilJ